ncbi:hypothetical protein IFR05_009598 [Cadophora sp. M221]|nr:hypothetical protein IFR05_009598 [Cadophora sp. M221]
MLTSHVSTLMTCERRNCDHLVSPNNPSSRPESGYRSHTPEPSSTKTPKPYYPSCRYIPSSVLQDLANVENLDDEDDPEPTPTLMREATRIFTDMDCTGENFLNLDYLFIVYTVEEHWRLLRVAPKQKYTFSIDSIAGYCGEPTNIDRKFLRAVLLSQVPKPDTWPVYREWAERGEDKSDGSPNCCRQGDDHNCGTMAATNAFCLAFGFNLQCYRQRDIDSRKRPRMFAELSNGGFSGKYAYDMLDIPHQPDFTDRSQCDPQADLPETLTSSSSTANTGGMKRPLGDSIESDPQAPQKLRRKN